MKKPGTIIIAIIIAICTLQTTAIAMWAYVPLEKLLAENSVVVAGKIEEIKTTETAKGKVSIAYIKVSEVLKNELKDFKIKVGDKIPLSVPTPGMISVSTDINYPKGKEGVWILEYKDKTFWATYPSDYQPLKEKAKIKEILGKQSKEEKVK